MRTYILSLLICGVLGKAVANAPDTILKGSLCASKTDLTNLAEVVEQQNHQTQLAIKALETRIVEKDMVIQKLTQRVEPDEYQFTSYACQSQNMSLACPDGQTILVTQADYGEYVIVCESACCSPHPYDCTEKVQTNDEYEWLALKMACDNETQCDYLFRGATFLEECTPAQSVDYMQVYFTCQPGEPLEAVGFSVYATEERPYEDGDIVIFDAIVSNFGGYFNIESNIFVCPLSGIYWFSVSCLSQISYSCTANIMIETMATLNAHGTNDPDARNTGTTSTVVECASGQRAWVKNDGSNRFYDDNIARTNSFSGYLLHRFVI